MKPKTFTAIPFFVSAYYPLFVIYMTDLLTLSPDANDSTGNNIPSNQCCFINNHQLQHEPHPLTFLQQHYNCPPMLRNICQQESRGDHMHQVNSSINNPPMRTPTALLRTTTTNDEEEDVSAMVCRKFSFPVNNNLLLENRCGPAFASTGVSPKVVKTKINNNNHGSANYQCLFSNNINNNNNNNDDDDDVVANSYCATDSNNSADAFQVATTKNTHINDNNINTLNHSSTVNSKGAISTPYVGSSMV